MISIDLLTGPVGLAIAAALALAVVVLFRRGVFRPILADAEVVNVGKILFIIGSIFLLVAINNSIALPEAQFIYGRF